MIDTKKNTTLIELITTAKLINNSAVIILPLLNSEKSSTNLKFPYTNLIAPFTNMAYEVMINTYLYTNLHTKVTSRIFLEMDKKLLSLKPSVAKHLYKTRDVEDIYATEKGILYAYDIPKKYLLEVDKLINNSKPSKLSKEFKEDLKIRLETSVITHDETLGSYIIRNNIPYQIVTRNKDLIEDISKTYKVNDQYVLECLSTFDKEKETVLIKDVIYV